MAEDKVVDFSKIDSKWQKKWDEKKVFEVDDGGKKKKCYVLEMYPYPSASGLHMGHAFNYTIGDIFARFRRMQGFNVLHPMGYDSFGLPAENAAIKEGAHPGDYTDKAISNFIRQQKSLGFSYDWTRKLHSHDPNYYSWNQHMFLEFYKKGLVYRKESPVNWCNKCNTVLANEQVIDGKCWRHKDNPIEIKNLEQWFIKTTDYADELLRDVDKIDWPERIKAMQRNWIGKSEGTEVDFKVGKDVWKVFTTRVDTLMGVTFLVVSAQHPKLMELVSKEQKKSVDSFVSKIRSTKQEDMDKMDKEGVFTGSYAKHPITGKDIPIWAGNFVVADYGSGMVMAVPAHDQRDLDFARKYNIAVKTVIEPITGEVKPNEEFRRSIVAVVENPKTASVLSINWGEKMGGNLLIGGGIDKDEDVVKTAIREIQEETGYKNLEFVSQSEKIHHHYFAHSKNVAREIEATGLYFRLKNEDKINQSLEADEKGKFTVEWIKKEQVLNKIKDPLHREVFQRLVLGWAYTGAGILANSDAFNGLLNDEAKEHIANYLTTKKLGRKVTNYKLRDWLVSRQRYWGTPIPMIYCDKCGIVPVPEKDLPILLPKNVKFGEGNPLATNKSFVECNCPKCKSKARRETDTMDTFFDSSWYYLRFCDIINKKKPFDSKKVNYWMPVDIYIGGAEHATMHLIYARFFTKALRDLGHLKFDEPFTRLFNQGMIHGVDGVVMSKSRGNVVDPLEISSKFGADSLRLFLVSMASPDKDFAWSQTGVESSWKLMRKIIDLPNKIKFGKSSKRGEHKINSLIKSVEHNIEYMKYNFAIIKIREFVESMEEEMSKKDFENFIRILSPFAPHIAEELWSNIKNKGFVSDEDWPKADESKIDEKIDQGEKTAEKTVADILNVLKIVKEKTGKEGNKVYLYIMPFEKDFYDGDTLSTKVSKTVKVYTVNDKDKHDPEGKSSKAKPGKPGIYVE